MPAASSKSTDHSSWLVRLLCCGASSKSKQKSKHARKSNSDGRAGVDVVSSAKTCDVPLSQEQLKEIINAFNACDSNRDGYISAEELRSMMRRFNRNETEAHLTAIIKSVDFDRDGRVSFEEFKTVYSQMCKVKQVEEAQADKGSNDMKCAFKVFDHDNDGYITLPEIKLAMSYLGEVMDDKQAQQMLDMADSNKDGKISEDEFVNIFGNLSQNMQNIPADNNNK